MFVFFRQSVPDGQSLSPRSFFYPRTITAISDERGYFPKKMKYTLVTMVVIAVSTLSNSFHKLSAASGWMVGETRLTQLAKASSILMIDSTARKYNNDFCQKLTYFVSHVRLLAALLTMMWYMDIIQCGLIENVQNDHKMANIIC